MNRLYSVLVGLLALSAALLGVLSVTGITELKWVYLLCYGLAVVVLLLPGGKGSTGRIGRLVILFLIFALIPYGWEQSSLFREGIDQYTPGVLGMILGWVLFTQGWKRES